MNILLIAGGWSSEREVALAGAGAIENALRENGHQVTLFDPEHSLDGLLDAASATDFAFVNLHGSPGEDGLIQAMLERVGCPYQGSGPAGSFLALNKAAAKQLFRNGGLTTADWVFLPEKPEKDWRPPFGYPLFIKHNTGGSSLGLERVTAPEELEPALDRIFAHGHECIAEQAITGLELTCGILGDKALAPVLIRSRNSAGVFDYANKYDSVNGAEEICPAPLPEADLEAVRRAALAAHRILGLSGYSRADFIRRQDGRLFILEVNTLPGMTSASLIPKEAREAGLSYIEFLEKLIALGQDERGNRTPPGTRR